MHSRRYSLYFARCDVIWRNTGVKYPPASRQTKQLAPIAAVHPKFEQVADDHGADVPPWPVRVQ